jgi:hypothetical protein
MAAKVINSELAVAGLYAGTSLFFLTLFLFKFVIVGGRMTA